MLAGLVIINFSCREKKQPPIQYGNNEKAGNYGEVNGIKMYYEIYGEGEPLLMLHGNGGSISVMREQISYFSKHFKVIAIDNRSQGKTNDNGDTLTYDEMAADINVLLDKLNIDSAYTIGQSDGAILGLILAYRYPAKIKSLAAMSPNIRPDSAVLYPKDDSLFKMNVAKYEDSLKAGNTVINGKLKLLRLMRDEPHIMPSQLATIKAPVMIMTGDRDVIQLSHIIEIFRAIPGCELCVLPGSTHSALRQNTEVFNETINHFFTKRTGLRNNRPT